MHELQQALEQKEEYSKTYNLTYHVILNAVKNLSLTLKQSLLYNAATSMLPTPLPEGSESFRLGFGCMQPKQPMAELL